MLRFIRTTLLCATIVMYLFNPSMKGAAASIVINEFMASNSSIESDPQGHYDDWIELYNTDSVSVNIGGMYLTDNLLSPNEWQIPDSTIIPAGGYLLIWADDEMDDDGLHAGFKLSGNGEEIGLFDVDGTLIDRITFGEQTTDVSYGRFPDASDNWRFFDVPTPGAENSGGYLGEVQPLGFSHKRGFYDEPFTLTIATETPGAAIFYTIDGSEPYDYELNIPRGIYYHQPVSISETTILRAVATRTGFKPTTVKTHTYLFLDNVIRLSQAQAEAMGYPSTWLDPNPSGAVRRDSDYEMDPEVYNDPAYRDLMRDAFLSIPTLSIVTDRDNLFSETRNENTGGIYIYTGIYNINDGWERPVSAEFFTQDGTEEFQVNCGLRLQGGEGRRPQKCPKHSFSLRFRDEYGPAKLDYKLFGEWPMDSFDTLQLRGFFNNAWAHWGADQRERAQYIRDQWMRDTLTEMGQADAGQGIFAHLYLNGIYWGLYNLHERPVASHYASYNGGNKDNVDAVNGDPQRGGGVTDGTANAWNQLKSTVTSRNWDRIRELLDVDNFIDWVLINRYAGNNDLKYDTNWRAAGGGPENKPWHFYSWDAEHVLEGINESQVNSLPDSDPTGLLGYLDDIEEFRVRFGDHVHKFLFNNGALIPENNIQRWLKRADELELAVIAESARWGDYRRDVHSYSSGPYLLYTRNDFWIPEKNRLINDYFPERISRAIDHFRQHNLYPDVDAPVFYVDGSYQHGGEAGSNGRLSMTATTGTIYYTLDGTDPRAPQNQQANISTTVLIAETATKRVLVPDSSVSNNWKGGGVFDHSTWQICAGGAGGIGYERSSGYEGFITLDLEDHMYNGNTTCYIRVPFVCNSDPDDFDTMTLRMRYDDGFIAYLNGVEIARRNFDGTPNWQSSASTTHSDGEAVNFEDIDVSDFLGNLQQGSNILAIQGLNAGATSSDLLFSFELKAGIDNTQIDDILSPGAIEYVRATALNNSADVKARVLNGSNWSALNEATFAVGPVADNLRITEIMYNPQTTADGEDPNEEFIELTNIGSESINLNLVSFTNGIDFTFSNIELAPGGFVVVVENIDAFEAQYGANINIAGQYAGKLNNNGERIRLEDAIGQTILDFSYGDGWRSITDGEGFSLTKIDPANQDTNSWDEKDSWRASAYITGSPGYDDSGIIPNPGAVVINELLADSPGTDPDWIELYNTTENSIDIGGWFLSDSGSNPAKYKIASGTTIAPDQYIVFYQDEHFDNDDDLGCREPFALSNNGESVYLTSAEGDVLTGYRNVEDFGPSQTGVSLGRYYKSSTDNYNFVAMEQNTPGAENANPVVGPIVINEIMYNPDWSIGGTYTNEQFEYIELYNISSGPVNPQGWKLTNGVDFTFPNDTTVTIPTGGYIIIAREPDAFALRYPTVEVQKIFGPYEGQLSNAGESLELGMPNGNTNDSDEPYYIRIDRINYSDGSHPENCPGGVDLWPTEADGDGLSLHRITADNYGNDPENWMAMTPSPGE